MPVIGCPAMFSCAKGVLHEFIHSRYRVLQVIMQATARPALFDCAGGVLHVHDEAMTSIEWLVKNVTYRADCYMCVNSVFNVKFHFFKNPPSDPGQCIYRLPILR